MSEGGIVTKEVRVQFEADSQHFEQGARRTQTAAERVARVISGLRERLRQVGSVGINFLRGFGEGAVHAFRQARTESVRADSALERVVGQLRRLSITSLALRGIGMLLGSLRGIVQQYISSNTAAQRSVNALKTAFANALAPAINVAINALTAILPVVQAVSNAFATLVTNLFGAKWTTITGGATAAAAAVGGVGQAANDAAAAQAKLNRELYGFDQITKASDNGSGGGGGGSSGGGGGGGGPSTETIGGGEGVLGLFSQLSGLFDPLKAAWENKGQAVMEAARQAFENVKGAVAAVKDSFVTVWTEGTGQAYVESLLNKWTTLLNIVSALSGTFTAAWTEAGRGDGVIRSIFERATSVNNMIAAIGQSFANAWTDKGQTIWANLLDTVTSVNNTVRNLADNFTDAWNSAGTGDGIMSGILSTVMSVTDSVKGLSQTTEEWAEKLDLVPLLASIQNLLTNIDPFVKGIGSALEGVWSVVTALGGWAVEGPVPDFLNRVAAQLELVGSISQKVGETVKAVGEWVSQIKFNGLEGLMNGEGLLSLPDVGELTVTLKSIWASGEDKNRVDAVNNTAGTKQSSLTARWSDAASRDSAMLFGNTENKSATATLNRTWGQNAKSGFDLYKSIKNSNAVKTMKHAWGRGSKGALDYYKGLQNKSVTVAIKANVQRKLSISDLVRQGSLQIGNNGGGGSVKIIPKARGGIVNAATLFGPYLVGEAGQEAIIPLENNTEWIDKVADRLSQRQQTVIEVHVGDERLVRKVVSGINAVTARTGVCPIYV